MNKLQGYIAGILLILAVGSCKDEPIEPVEPAPDCNCDRYIEHSKFGLPDGTKLEIGRAHV